MTEEEVKKKYQEYDGMLSSQQFANANTYRAYSYRFLIATWVSAIVFIGIGSAIKTSFFTPNLQTWMIMIGIILVVFNLGLFCIFDGKDIVLRQYSLGRWYSTYNGPLFGEGAVKWGKTMIVTGYLIITLLAAMILIIGIMIKLFPH